MKKLFLVTISLMSFHSFAEGSLHAHEHGALSLEAAVEGNFVQFNIDGPAESLLGFENLPKTVKEKKVYEEVKNKWENDFLSLVTFDAKLGCSLSEKKFEQILEKEEKKNHKEKGEHSEIEASIKVTCKEDLKGKKVSINLLKNFKKIKKLKFELVGSTTKTYNIKSDSFEVSL